MYWFLYPPSINNRNKKKSVMQTNFSRTRSSKDVQKYIHRITTHQKGVAIKVYRERYDKTEKTYYFKCSTFKDFEKWCRDGFWKSVQEFTEKTGLCFEDIENKWFSVVHT
jgi:hypothetical protein